MVNEHLFLGVDQQIQAALVAAQLDYDYLVEVLQQLRDVRFEIDELTAGSASDSSPTDNELAKKVVRIIDLLIRAFDERNQTSIVRIRRLQDAIMDRLAIVDALEAKVAILEQHLKGQ